MTARRGHRALRILGGVTAMALFSAGLLWTVMHFAGGWGVPYFAFTTDNGSRCTNTWSGFTCASITPADYELYARETIPPGTTLTSGSMVITHDYRVQAVLVTTKAQAATVGKTLITRYGACGAGPTPEELAQAAQVCRMSTDDDATGTDKAPPDKVYTVTTGVMKNGQRVTVVQIQSR